MTEDRHKVSSALVEMDGGKVIAAIQTEIESVVDEVTSRFDGKSKGRVTLTLDITRNGEEMVEIMPSITTKMPSRSMRHHAYFFGDEGSMHRRSPYQGDIEDVIEISKNQEA